MRLKTMFVAVALALASRGRRVGLSVGAVDLEIDKAAWTKLPKDVQALYVEKDGKYRLDGVEVEDTSGLKSALASEREARKKAEKATKDLAEKWGDLDPVQIKSMIDKLGGDEEAQLIRAGKIDEVVSRRTEKQRLAHEKALKSAGDLVAAAEARTAKFSQRVLDNHIRAAAGKAGMHANAVEDALFRARAIFQLDDEGGAVQLDADKKPVMGKDGKTLYSPAEWLDGMKETAPHWFPAGNTGGGAQGNKGANGAKTMKRSDFDALDPVSRSTAVKEKVQIVD